MFALPKGTSSVASALALAGAVVTLSACPERNHIPNFESRADAAVQVSPGPPARIILLIGDGMGPGQIASASYSFTGTPEGLEMHNLPMRGKISTASSSGITDSSASATAMATGQFTFNGWVGIDEDAVPVENLVELAKRYGLATGLVTTTRLAHATPASFAAHVNSRGQYQDIALQMAQLRPNVMLGGGRRDFESRDDGLNLIDILREANYQYVSNAQELDALPPNDERPLLGLFANDHLPYVIDRTSETDEGTPTLSAMARAALDRLDSDPDGFFLMIEGGRIDHAGHANDLAKSVGETLAFDRTIASVLQWVGTRDDVTILVTADHETGGLQVNGPTAAGEPPNASWRWGNHTNTTIANFGRGPGVEVFDGVTRDHRWVHAALSGLIRGQTITPPRVILPNGSLEDLVGATIGEERANPADAATRLTRMTMSSSERGIGIGLEGLYRWDEGAVVLLLDVDYGLATGLRTLNGIADDDGSANKFLSRIQLPIVPDNSFGADMVFLSQHGLSTVYSSSSSGLRGLRDPYGDPQDLGRIQAASNFSDNARSNGEASVVESSRGLEIFIRWQDLYPGQSAPPPDTSIAIWAVQVNEDGSVTNQSLPPWQNENTSRAPMPLVMQLP